MVAATVDGMRIVSLYAPNGRVVGSPFYDGKLAWFERLARWVARAAMRPDPRPRWRPQRGPDRRRRLGRGGRPRRHARLRAGAGRLPGAARTRPGRWLPGRPSEPGRFSWWDYRAGMFHKNLGMRIDHLLVSRPSRHGSSAPRSIATPAKGPPVPSDHAPLADRPRRTRAPGRPRLGRRPGPDQGADEARALVGRELVLRGSYGHVPQDPADDVVGRRTCRNPSYESTISTSSPRSSRPSSSERSSSGLELIRTL